MEGKLYPIDDVIDFIHQGDLLALAGDEMVLSKLPKGNWVAGTIPYFMDVNEGLFSQELIYVNKLADATSNFKIKVYDENNIDEIVTDSYKNGFSFIIIPAFQQTHQAYALKAEEMQGLYNNPIVGWISGIDLNSDNVPKTYNGIENVAYENKAVVAHVELPENAFAQIEIVNIFKQDPNSVEIEFFTDSFEIVNCLINGEEQNFAQYLKKHQIDTKLPLVADYSGASINVSIKEVDDENGIVSFYAPVFASKTYRFAAPVNNYVKEFEENIYDLNENNQFSCNCILNYLYGELEGRKIKNAKGPITFGEIGYQLLNQTMVTLSIEQ